jgi:hypothetical protein
MFLFFERLLLSAHQMGLVISATALLILCAPLNAQPTSSPTLTVDLSGAVPAAPVEGQAPAVESAPQAAPSSTNQAALESAFNDPKLLMYWRTRVAELRAKKNLSFKESRELLLGLRRLDDWREGLRLATQLSEDNPRELRWKAWQALFQIRAGKYRTALELLEKADAAADASEYALASGLLMWHAGSPDSAVPYLSQAGIQSDFTDEVLIHLIMLYRSNRTWKQEAFTRRNYLNGGETQTWPIQLKLVEKLDSSFDRPELIQRPRQMIKLPQGIHNASFTLHWITPKLLSIATNQGKKKQSSAIGTKPGSWAIQRLEESSSWNPDYTVPAILAEFDDGTTGYLVLDSLGPMEPLLDLDFASNLQEDIAAKGESPEARRDVLAKIPYQIVHNIKLGGTDWVDFVFRPAELELVEKSGKRIAGIIPITAFWPRAVLIDFKNDRIAVESEPTQYNIDEEVPMLEIAGHAFASAQTGGGNEFLVTLDTLASATRLGYAASEYIRDGKLIFFLGDQRTKVTAPQLSPLMAHWGEQIGTEPGLLLGVNDARLTADAFLFDYPYKALLLRTYPEE